MFRLQLFLILFLFSFFSEAQAACSKEFKKMDKACVKSLTGNLKELKFLVTKKDDKILNNIYFYRTSSGNIGKFQVQNVVTKKNECSLYLTATTYIGNELYTPTASFSAVKRYGNWEIDKRSFDHRATDDFSLYVSKGKCIFKANFGRFVLKEAKSEQFAGSELLYYTSFFLIGLAVFLIAMTIFKEEDSFKAQATLEDADDAKDIGAVNDIVLKYSRPFFRRYFSPIVKGMKNKRKIKDKYKRKLASSGLTQYLTPEDFFAFKLFLIIGFPILFLFVRWFLEESWPLSYVPIVSIVGFFYPDIWINGKIQKRQREILNSMPFVIDMLALSVEAGLDFMAAMQKVIEKAPPSALVEEFEILIKETKVGSSRADGLRQMSWRVDMLPISSFCATLIAADAVGASIGPILKTLAGEVRQKRSAEIEKIAATAPTKILIPTIFFIIPAVFLMIAAPLVIDFIRGGG